MEARLIALKLLLDELGVPDSIDTIDDRKRVQKAIYLGQLSGVDLGYRFGWYLKGPYSPALSKDYYALADDLQAGDNEHSGKSLTVAVTSRLEKIRPLLKVPESVPLTQEDWLELVSSVHYLRKISKYNETKAHEVLVSEKPTLVPYIEAAKAALKTTHLLD